MALEFVWPVLATLLGFACLVWGADRFVEGAAATARHAGVSSLLVGLTVVGFGTSAPELLVSSVASIRGSEGIAIGNAVGSNVFNLSIVLGAGALVRPMDVPRSLARRELPLLMSVTTVAGFLLYDGTLSAGDGVLLLAGLGGIVTWMVVTERKAIAGGSHNIDDAADDAPEPGALASAGPPQSMPPTLSRSGAAGWLVVGLAALLLGARAVVWGAEQIASSFAVPEVVVGLTVVALGTSLPELAATVMSALKGEHALALGNVVGSNLFNTLGVLGFPGLLAPGLVTPVILGRDYPVMAILLVVVFLLCRRARIGRGAGTSLVVAYLAYLGVLLSEA